MGSSVGKRERRARGPPRQLEIVTHEEGEFSQLRPEVFGEALSDLLPVTRAVFASPVPRYIVVLAIWAALARPEQGVDFSGAIRAAQRLLGSKAAAAEKEQEPKGR